MYYFKLYGSFIKVYLKTRMEYRFSFFSDLFAQILTFSVMYLNLWILMTKFHDIQGWNYYEVMFLYNLNIFTYGISGLFIWEPMLFGIQEMVQQGTFDSIITKPINPLLHMIFRQFEHTFLGHIILGFIVFVICMGKLSIVWTFANIIWFILVLLGAVLIHCAIMIIGGSVSFWIIKSTAVVNTAIYGLRNFISYPVSVYNKWVQVILTFIVPYAFVNYYPAQLFLNKPGETLFHPLLKYGTPIVGVLLLIISILIWNIGINKYQSTGC